MPQIDEQIKLADLEKTQAESQKIRSETENLRNSSRTELWSELAKVFGAIILGLGGVTAAITQYQLAQKEAEIARQNLEFTQYKLNQANVDIASASQRKTKIETELQEAEKNLAEAIDATESYKSELSNLTAKATVSEPTLVPNQLVYVQFRGDISRPLINDYRAKLNKDQYNSPGAERISGEYENSVRYFSKQDQESALKLADLTSQYFASKGCPININPEKISHIDSPPQLEVWIHHSC